MSDRLRVVFDCNIFLQALANPDGPSGRCLSLAFSGHVELFLSPVVLDEIRKVTAYPKLVAKFKLRATRVDALLLNLAKVAVVVPAVPEVWHYERDPGDAHYVNLALVVNARLIVSRDRDLLDLMDTSKPEAAEFQSRFPSLKIVDPLGLLSEFSPPA